MLDVLMHSSHLPHEWASRPPMSEGDKWDPNGPCATFRGASICGIEESEWTMVEALVNVDATVLELGARFGTTSCVLANATKNSGRVVSVEPDTTVHADLEANLRSHSCNVTVVKGTVSTHSLVLPKSTDYSTKTRVARVGETTVPSMSFLKLETTLGYRFDTLLVDCEGCIGLLLDGQLDLLDQIDLLLIEEDARKVAGNYAHWHRTFEAHGLEKVWHSQDMQITRVVIEHTAWVRRNSSRTQVSCTEYALRRHIPIKRLKCLDGKQSPHPRPQSTHMHSAHTAKSASSEQAI